MAKLISVRDIQKGVVQMGMGDIPIDGSWGPITQAAFGDFIHFHLNDIEYEMIPAANRREMQISPDIIVDTLRAAAREHDNRTFAQTPTRAAPSAPAVAASPPSRSFFRANNPWLWALVGVAAGGLGYYGYKKRWFR